MDWGEKKPDVKFEWPLVRRVFAYFIPYWRQSLLVLLLIGVGSAVSLVPAWAQQQILQKAFKSGASVNLLLVLVVVWVAASVIDSLLSVAQSYTRALISQGIMYGIRRELFEKILHQSVAFFTKSRTGDVMSRLNNDVGGIQDVVSGTIFDAISNVVILGTTIALMASWSWQLTLVAVAVVPLFSLPIRRVGRASFDARKQTQAQLSKVTSLTQEVLGISGVLLVKAFGKERAERLRFRDVTEELRRLEIRQTMVGRWFFMIMRVLGTAGPAILIVAGGLLVINSTPAAAARTASIVIVITFSLVGRLYGGVQSLASLQVNVVGSLALFQRIFEYIDLPHEITDKPDAIELDKVTGRVTFDDVTFSYSGKGKPALDHVSFDIEPGQLVALVGPSGAGKTTITSMVPRFYDPQEGAIRIDGHDVRDVTLESLADQIGVVFQDTFLFHASVRDNLLYARPGATDEEMVAAARAANIHDFIESLPEGYETVVGERGHRLSGGEKQRLSIARVILRDPRILILDEATSNLDSESEHLIQAALKPLFAGRTSIVIAHRLSTILQADLILVLDRGRLVERGDHFELLGKGGLYASLYQRQFGAGRPQAAAV